MEEPSKAQDCSAPPHNGAYFIETDSTFLYFLVKMFLSCVRRKIDTEPKRRFRSNSTNSAFIVSKVNADSYDSTSKTLPIPIRSPSKKSRWIRGQPVVIEWEDSTFASEHVNIYLHQLGSKECTVIGKNVPNKGIHVYKKIPWGMVISHGYYITITSVDENTVQKSHTFPIAR